MDCRIVVLSDKILRGDKTLDFLNLSKLLLSYGIFIKDISIKNENEKFDDFSSPTFLFLHDDKIDEFISKNKIFYSTKSEIIDNEGVLAGETFPILIIPIEGDIYKIFEDSLNIIKGRYNLPKISIFRLFGKNIDQVTRILKEKTLENQYYICGNNFLTDIYLKDANKEGFISQDEVVLNELFGDYIYSQSCLGMAEVVSKILILSNLKINISDSFTGGKIVSELLQMNENARIFSDTFIVKKEINFLQKEGEEKCYRDESEMVYQMAFNKLEEKKFDVAVVIAAKKKENGYNIFISLGRKTSVDVYNLSIEGNREDAIAVAKDATIFNLIKKLRLKDFEN